jgi:hypothetical protein
VTGLSLAALSDRTGFAPERLLPILDAEVGRGRIECDEGRYRLVTEAFSDSQLRGLQLLALERPAPARRLAGARPTTRRETAP